MTRLIPALATVLILCSCADSREKTTRVLLRVSASPSLTERIKNLRIRVRTSSGGQEFADQSDSISAVEGTWPQEFRLTQQRGNSDHLVDIWVGGLEGGDALIVEDRIAVTYEDHEEVVANLFLAEECESLVDTCGSVDEAGPEASVCVAGQCYTAGVVTLYPDGTPMSEPVGRNEILSDTSAPDAAVGDGDGDGDGDTPDCPAVVTNCATTRYSDEAACLQVHPSCTLDYDGCDAVWCGIDPDCPAGASACETKRHASEAECLDLNTRCTSDQHGCDTVWCGVKFAGACTVAHDSDGDYVYESRNEYTYDDDGNVLVHESYTGAADTPNARTSTVYGIDGNVRTRSYDTNADGMPDRIDTFTREAGNLVSHEIDYNADGTVVSRYTYTYDGGGNRLTEEYDLDGGGTADTRTTYTYDSSGNQLTSAYDSDADGAPESRESSTYDSAGNQLTWERDSDADGSPNSSRAYTYDSAGNQLTWENDTLANGSADDRTTYTYDTSGGRLSSEYDANVDGTIESRTTSSYGPYGFHLTEVVDDDADPATPNKLTRNTFDAAGNLLLTTVDQESDGAPDSITAYTYDCWQ